MADWRDGAEYAPTARPGGFATPRTEPLDAPPPVVDLAAGQPPFAPDAFQPSPMPAPPLEQLVPRPDVHPRNPAEPFATTSALTQAPAQPQPHSQAQPQAGAWGSAHSTPHAAAAGAFDPRAAMTTSANSIQPGTAGPGAPAPGGHGWAPPTGQAWAPPGGQGWAPPGGQGWAPPGGPPVPAAPQTPVEVLRSIVSGMGVPLVLSLIAAAVLPPIAFVFLVVSTALAMAAKVAKETLLRVVGISCALALVLGLVFPFDLDAWAAICRWAQILAALSLLVCGYIVWQQGKRPPAQPGR